MDAAPRTVAEERRQLCLRLMRAVEKCPALLAKGRRLGAPAAAQEALRERTAAARTLLAGRSTLEDLQTSLDAVEEASHWILDPGPSKEQEDPEVLARKLRRLEALVHNAPEVAQLRKKEKKAEATQLRIELGSQLLAPSDETRLALAENFRQVCEALDRKCERSRMRRNSGSPAPSPGWSPDGSQNGSPAISRRVSLGSEEAPTPTDQPRTIMHSSTGLGIRRYLSGFLPFRSSEPQQEAFVLQVESSGQLREWDETDSFGSPRRMVQMETNALKRLSREAQTLSAATDQVASMVQTDTFNVVEERVRQTVEDSQEVVETLRDVAVGKSRSRVQRATLVVGVAGAAVGVLAGLPLLGSVAIAAGTATLTALTGKVAHDRFAQRASEVATGGRQIERRHST